MASIEHGASLARRHQKQRRSMADGALGSSVGADFDPNLSLLNYAERPLTDQWTLRSALVRLAQPHPQLAAGLLTANRRLDAVLQPARTKLLKLPGPAQHPAGPDHDQRPFYLDTRLADIARLAAHLASDQPSDRLAQLAGELLTGYQTVPLKPGITDLERRALPLLSVAAKFEVIAVAVSGWAARGHQDPPVEAVQASLAWSEAALDALAVPADAGAMPAARSYHSRNS